ncbi:MAG: hypothetical protein LWX54_08570 [Deltaproteobacteria bacterium]|nr:hypothetical protein [Deltaproteobacteria bacterium]MDL1984226.1 hypothetical protein [Deltaproteobacteria bacterium]
MNLLNDRKKRSARYVFKKNSLLEIYRCSFGNRGGNLYGYEIKWKNVPVKIPKDWRENYPNASFEVIH